jgi:hypothetical protein
LFTKILQNRRSVNFTVNPNGFTVITLEKGANQCFLAFCKTIRAHFLPFCPPVLLILRTKKSKILVF